MARELGELVNKIQGNIPKVRAQKILAQRTDTTDMSRYFLG